MNNKNIALLALSIAAPIGWIFRKTLKKHFYQVKEKVMPARQGSDLSDYTHQPSADGSFTLAYSAPKAINGELLGSELVLLQQDNVLYSRLMTGLSDVSIGNNGFVAVCQDLDEPHYNGYLSILNARGETVFNKKMKYWPLHAIIDTTGQTALFIIKLYKTRDESRLWLINTLTGETISQFELPFLPQPESLDAATQVLSLKHPIGTSYRFDFAGHWQNAQEVANALLAETQPEALLDQLEGLIPLDTFSNLQLNKLVDHLLSLLTEAPASIKSRAAFALRALGEQLEASADFLHAVEMYQHAVDLYDKVGVKRKINQLKSRLNGQE